MRFASAAGRPGTPRVTSAGTRRSRSTAIGTKQLTPSVRGFRTMKTTYATTKGFEVTLPMGSILHLQTVPESGGDTLIANMYTAYEALSEPVKELIGQLSAWHESAHVSGGRFGNRAGTHDGVRQYPKALHPMVTKHRVTGRECLFVNENYTTRIEGLAERESEAILKMLYDHITAPEFQTRFHWEPNSIAFWDNRCVQHRSEWDYYPATRHGYQVTVCDDAARGQP